MNLNEDNAITKKINMLRSLAIQKKQNNIYNNNIQDNGSYNGNNTYDYSVLLNNFEDCIKKKNGYKLHNILKLNQLPVHINVIDNMTENELLKMLKKKKLLKNYEQLIIDHFNIIKILCNKNCINWDLLLTTSCKFLSTFINIYCHNLWLLPYLLYICFFLNNISKYADMCSSNINNTTNTNKDDIYNEENEDIHNKNKYTIEVLNSIRGKIGTLKGDVEKHGAFIILMLQSIKLCMKLNNMQTTSSFLKIINSADISYSYIPKSFIVLFKYQLGMLYLQKLEYEKAEKEFIWAFSNSNKNKISFKKKILEAIICIRLNKGIYPPKHLLINYDLNIYIKIIYSMKKGNVFLYNNVVRNYSNYFFKYGLNECIDQIHFVVNRNLLKIIVDWWNKIVKDNLNKIY
ncbi:PCI domain-containing protein, putative, partial [Hepatocystis sp. ex Piliocolobus tephrosceles]